MPQALLIFDGRQAEASLSAAASLVNVIQRLPPRLAIAEGDIDRLAAARDIPGIIGVFEGHIPETMLRQLNATERLFAEAWAESRRPKSDRRGDGLPWDAEGFEPPDGKDGV